MLTAPAGTAVFFAGHSTMRGAGMSTTGYMGAAFERVSHGQHKAAETIVENLAGSKRGADESGEPAETPRTEQRNTDCIL